jgi:hypothetical protein
MNSQPVMMQLLGATVPELKDDAALLDHARIGDPALLAPRADHFFGHLDRHAKARKPR